MYMISLPTPASRLRGDRLRDLRVQAGVSLDQIAAESGCPAERLRAAEAGEAPLPLRAFRVWLRLGLRPVLLCCGGRDFGDLALLRWALTPLRPARLVHGAAAGADAAAAAWAEAAGMPVTAYPADWAQHGKSAGVQRNRRMLDAEDTRLDLLVAFPGGRGTADMCARAAAAGLPVFQPQRRCLPESTPAPESAPAPEITLLLRLGCAADAPAPGSGVPVISAMSRTPAWVRARTAGQQERMCALLSDPDEAAALDLALARHRMPLLIPERASTDYRAMLERRWAAERAAWAPGRLRYDTWAGLSLPVPPGAWLVCTCPRGQPCHRRWLAPHLEAAGWRVERDGDA